MAYYEGIDYHVRYVRFPNYASEAMILSNGDGTYSIYLNSLFPEETLRRRLGHELEHLRRDHLHQPDRPVWEKEAEADGLALPAPQPPPEPAARAAVSPPAPGRGVEAYFDSWRKTAAWVRRRLSAPLERCEK